MFDVDKYINDLFGEGQIILGGEFSNLAERYQVVEALKNIASVDSGKDFLDRITSGAWFLMIQFFLFLEKKECL